MKTLNSQVKGHEGMCAPTWLNNSLVDRRISGGITGFFKNVKRRKLFGLIPYWSKYGKEFHGVIKEGCVVTKTMEGR